MIVTLSLDVSERDSTLFRAASITGDKQESLWPVDTLTSTNQTRSFSIKADHNPRFNSRYILIRRATVQCSQYNTQYSNKLKVLEWLCQFLW